MDEHCSFENEGGEFIYFLLIIKIDACMHAGCRCNNVESVGAFAMELAGAF